MHFQLSLDIFPARVETPGKHPYKGREAEPHACWAGVFSIHGSGGAATVVYRGQRLLSHGRHRASGEADDASSRLMNMPLILMGDRRRHRLCAPRQKAAKR